MNTYIVELSGMVPMCSAMSRKLDKITVLRMAVQHMKTLQRSQVQSYTQGHYKPFITDEDLKHLTLQVGDPDLLKRYHGFSNFIMTLTFVVLSVYAFLKFD